MDCDEFYNLTVAHQKCSRELKRDRNPFEAFSGTVQWPEIKANAEKVFSGQKLEIFLSPHAGELIEQNAAAKHATYITLVIRSISLIQLGWLNEEGRDSTTGKQESELSFQVTDAQMTSRLRRAWALNQILHPLPPGKRWPELSESEQKQFSEKNEGDLRQHALDAMVISCTLPWLASRSIEASDPFGRQGWWTQDENNRSKVANPVFPQEGRMQEVLKKEIEQVVVRHHVSRSTHQQGYNATVYGKKAPGLYVVRKPFNTVTVKNIANIYPKELSDYCKEAWDCYVKEFPDITAELAKTDKCVPESFSKRLCFSNFQRWRAASGSTFVWPESVKIPIKSVRVIGIRDDLTAVAFSRGTRGFVERTKLKEVRIHPSPDGKGFVPVFVPYWKKDLPFSQHEFATDSRPVAVIKRGQIVDLKRPLGAGAPPGIYRVLGISQLQLRLLPPHISNAGNAKVAFHLPRTGIRPYWQEFIRCLGHERQNPTP